MTLIPLPDGRNLDIYVSGPDSGVPLIYHHGTPGAFPPVRIVEREAHAAGLRYVSYSRAGVGDSTRNPGRSVADVARDVEAVLDYLGAPRAVCTGTSGGGPHSLACAALLPDRIVAATLVSGVGPSDASDLDFTAGMGEENVQEFDIAAQGEGALRPFLEQYAQDMRTADVQRLIDAMGSLLPEVDQAVITGEGAADLVASMQEGLRTGIDGWLDDDLAFVRPWGFELSSVEVPTFVWQGDADMMVPFTHGEWLAAHIPGATAHLLPGEGHLSTEGRYAAEQIAELAATLG